MIIFLTNIKIIEYNQILRLIKF